MSPRIPHRAHARSLLVVGSLVLLTAAGGCGRDDATSADDPGATTSTADGSDGTASPGTDSSSPTEATAPADAPSVVPEPVTELVYYLVDVERSGVRLAREPHELLGEQTPEETARAAVEAMIAGPDDPEYASTWDPATKVLSVTRDAGVVTVDLSDEARNTSAGSDAAERMKQQLVYTVTEILGDRLRVALTIDGQEPGDLWGTVRWDRPVRRADPMTVRQLVQIDTPAEGETTGRRVRVTGQAATFEANVPWRIYDGTGGVVRRGFTTAKEGMTLSPYSFTVRLRPGTYTVEVTEDDPSGGEGQPPRSDTRTFTVG